MKQRFTKRTRLVSALLTLAMVFTFLPFSAFAAGGTHAHSTIELSKQNFPDDAFRDYLKSMFDKNYDRKLAPAERNAVKQIVVWNMGIRNLKGIEFFPNLKYLNCTGNELTSLDVHENTALTYLDCSKNQLTSLDVRNNTALDELYCYQNQLTSLDVRQNTALKMLSCGKNKLTSLDVTQNTALEGLHCTDNPLSSLNVSQNKELADLYCYENQLTELDVSKNTELVSLACNGNRLTSLDVSQNAKLVNLYCNDNQLTELDVRQNTGLKLLQCYSNRLSSLDVSKNTALKELSCNQNQLSSLDVSRTAVTSLDASNNKIDINVEETPRTFDLSILPAGFDVNKASGWVGGTVSGKTLKVKPGATQVTYTYDCGKGFSRYFTLNVIVIPDGTIFINASNFPDAVFRDQVKWKIADGNDTLTEQQRNQLQELSLPQGIKDLKGIEYFENLEKLEGVSVGLKYLDVTKNKKLKHLNVDTNQLEYLKVTENTGLEYLHCGSNQLTELDVTHNRKLSKLWCYNNQFTKLDVSKNSDLVWLGCGSNSLTELDVSRNPKLEMLLCFDNQLTELDLSKNTALTELDCSGNHLTSLELTSYIKDTDFKADGNVYDITIDRTDRTFDLSGLPGNFKPEKVQQWNGGSVKSGTSILTVDKGVSQVTYTYDCGFSRKAVFTLRVTETGSAPVDPPVTPPSGGDTPGGTTPGGSTGGGDGGGAVVIVAAAGAVAAGVVGYGVYNYVSGRKLQALLPEGVAAPENRAQTALLLWNTAGRPEPAEAPAFADVADPDTAKAAQWCVEQGLMKRRLNGKFAPGSSIPAYQVLNAYRKLAG